MSLKVMEYRQEDTENEHEEDYEELMDGGTSVGNLTANRMVFVLWGIGTLALLIYLMVR